MTGTSAFTAQWTSSHTPESRENNNEHMMDKNPPPSQLIPLLHTDYFALRGSVN